MLRTLTLALTLCTALSTSALAVTSASTPLSTSAPVFTTGGFAEIVIDRPVAQCFEILTNVNGWPDINKGVTLAIEPAHIKLKKGVIFHESIASPVPGVPNWKNDWTVQEFVPGKRFVIMGRDNFSKTPMHSRITYVFAAKTAKTTTFRRTIEVDMSDEFRAQASKSEVEALAQFLGSQWDMAQHLKKYVESTAR